MLPPPDESQSLLLEAPLSERRMVTAGPGAGKTTTSIMLIDRIARHSYDFDDPTVLFVSFSRSAMSAALTAFDDVLHDRSLDVAAMTLDSLAWQLVDDPGDGLGGAPDFDAVVRKATQALSSDYQGELDDVVHLIVDEAQDMSKPRRDFLRAIIRRLDDASGLTLFGDPMQTIYGFLDGDSEASNWEDLRRMLEEQSVTKTYRLTEDHRARRRGPKTVSACSESLRYSTATVREDILDDLLTEFTHWNIDQLAHRLSGLRGSTAVLAFTNAEVLHLYQELVDRGHRCVWREPGPRRQPVSPWVARLWSANDGNPVSRSDFKDFASDDPAVDHAWFGALLADAGRGDNVDWPLVASACRSATDPTAPWFEDPRTGLVVSTIHQAKGLEWDNVIVARAYDLLIPVGRRQPQHEILYVALSRARDRIFLVEDWKPPYMKSSYNTDVIYQPGHGSNPASAIGITPDCLVSDRMVGGDDGQRTLASSSAGSEARFDLLASGHSDWPTYRCSVGGTAVGVTTSDFGKAIAALPAARLSAWPEIGPVRLDGVESRWSTIGGISFWLKPRPFGLASLQWRG